MTDTDQLRADLTRALQPHLPPEHVAPLADAVVESACEYLVLDGAASGLTAADWVFTALRTLPEPYRSLGGIAVAIEPLVRRWWRDRLVDAPKIVVVDERG